MILRNVTFTCMLLAVLFAPLLSAGGLLVNGGFETGNFAGWTANVQSGSNGNLFVISGATAPLSGYATAGPASGTYYATSDQSGQGAYSLTQSFTVAPGQLTSFSFDLFADNQAGTNYNGPLDYTVSPNQHVTVDLLDGAADPFSTSAGVLQNFYLGSDNLAGNPNPYTHYSFDISSLVAAGGTFQVRFGEADNQLFYQMGVDNVSVNAGSATPEPATALLLIPAIGGLMLWKRKGIR